MPRRNKIVNIYSRFNGFVVSFDYDQDAVEDLKLDIPHTYRDYDPELRQWHVEMACRTLLQDWARAHFDKAILHRKEGTADVQYDFLTGKREAVQESFF